MKQFTLFALLIILSVAANSCWACSDEDFAEFKAKHEKIYETEEEEANHRQIFCENMQRVKSHNERYENGEESYTIGINNFSDWTKDEISKRLLGGLRRPHHRKINQ